LSSASVRLGSRTEPEPVLDRYAKPSEQRSRESAESPALRASAIGGYWRDTLDEDEHYARAIAL
jgi:hypothetical protein